MSNPYEGRLDKYKKYFNAGYEMKDWYIRTREDIGIASRQLDCRPEYLAGLLAAFSPRVSVRRSVKWALHCVSARKLNKSMLGPYGLSEDHFMDDVPKSVRIHVNKFLHTGLVTGPKTGPFHRALLGDPQAVVIDSHMLAAAGFDRSGTKQTMQECDELVRDVAYRRCSPAEAQAAIWCGFLPTIGRKPGYMPLLEVLWDV